MDQDSAKHNEEQVFDPHALLTALLERKKIIVGVMLFALLIGYTFVTLQRPQYRSTALIQLNTHTIPILEADSLVLGRVDDKAAIQSELDILRSPELAERVIAKLALHQKEEFNRTLLKSQDGQARQKAEIIRNVQTRMHLRKDPLSHTVHLSFDSEKAERAQNIANAYAQEYLNAQKDARRDKQREANAWLSQRVQELRQDVINSERAVQAFAEQNNLFELEGMTLDDQQISEINTQAAKARSEETQALAKLNQAKALLQSQDGAEAVPEVLSSPLIQKLHEQEAELLRERSELSGHFGPKHPVMVRVNGEISKLRGKILAETKKIVQGLENEWELAKTRADTLDANVERMRDNKGTSMRQTVALDDLKREAQANRHIYESFLERLKQTDEALNFEQMNAKIIARAQLPLEPFKPNKPVIMMLFAMGGLFTGITLALLLEYFSRGYASPQSLEDALGVEMIGMLPEIPNLKRETIPNFADPAHNSVYSEALRRVMASLQHTFKATAQRSFLVLSSLPQEGKGWLSASLASLMAQSGKKVLLLDCDLHKKSIGSLLGYETDLTLNDYLSGDADIKDVIHVAEESKLHFIGSKASGGNVQNMLENEAMSILIDYANAHYDLVIIDSPPVVGLSDIYFLSSLVDQCIFLVQWAKTPKHVVQHAFKILKKAHMNIIGSVLSRVDMAHYRRHEFGRSHLYKQYGDYYQELDDFHVSMADKVKSKIVRFRARP